MAKKNKDKEGFSVTFPGGLVVSFEKKDLKFANKLLKGIVTLNKKIFELENKETESNESSKSDKKEASRSIGFRPYHSGIDAYAKEYWPNIKYAHEDDE